MKELALLVLAGVLIWVITSLLVIAIKHIIAKVKKAKNGVAHEDPPF
jgi:predicted RND superfamily exporter protein